VIAALMPFWLIGAMLPPTLSSEYMDVLQVCSLLWLPIAGVFAGRGNFLFGPIFREQFPLLFWVTAGMVAITASALASVDPIRSLGYVLAAALGLISCAGLWQVVGDKMRWCLSAYAVLGSGLTICLYAFGPRVQGRLSASATSHPNFLGLVAFGVLMCALAMSNRLIASALIAANLLVIIATESRGSLVASLLGLVVYGALQARRLKRFTAFVIAVVAMALILVLPWYLETIQTSVSALLFLDDKYRGLGTGFTGRLDAWQEAIALFRENPVLGVGFRMHEHYMTTLSSAHNGYLSLLAESGVLGTFSWLLVTALAIGRLFRRALKGDSLAALGLSFSLGYLFLAAFERFFLNMGNPTSILTWLFLLMPSMGRSPVTRAAAPTVLDRKIWLFNTRAS